MVAMKYLDWKAVMMLSTVYNCVDVDTGQKHWKTKEIIKRPSVIVAYNKKNIFSPAKFINGKCFYFVFRVGENEFKATNKSKCF